MNSTTDTTSANPADDPLRQLWQALLDALVADISKPNRKAATMEVARSFLRDNGVDVNRLSVAEGLQALADKALDLPFATPEDDLAEPFAFQG